MKRILLLVPVLLTVFPALVKADGVLDAFVSRASASTLSFEFDISAEGTYGVSGSGRAVVRGESFHVSADGLDIWCDGKSMWVLDNGVREAVLTDASVNPAAFIGSIHTYFKEEGSGPGVFRRMNCHSVRMKSAGNSAYDSMVLYFTDGTLRALTLGLKDGSADELVIKGLRFSDEAPSFSPDISGLSSDWIVTDMRQPHPAAASGR